MELIGIRLLLLKLDCNRCYISVRISLHQEMERYHSALSKMAEDIIALRTQVVTLEAEKSRLCIDLSLHQDLGRHLLDNTDIDIMTKAELADSIGISQQSIMDNLLLLH